MFPVVERFTTQETDANTPITEMVVNSLIAEPTAGDRLKAGRRSSPRHRLGWRLRHRLVEVSLDGGTSWRTAIARRGPRTLLLPPWSALHAGQSRPATLITARAANRQGQTQVTALLFNPAGYHNNVPQRLDVTAA